MVLIWIPEVVFSQGLVKSCLLSGRVGEVLFTEWKGLYCQHCGIVFYHTI